MPRPVRTERASFYRRMPLWLQWALPFTVAIAAVAVIIIFVAEHNSQDGAEAPVSAQNLKSENQQAASIERQQEQPHTVKVAAGLSPARALQHAITTRIDSQYAKNGAWGGKVSTASCATVSASVQSPARVALKCRVTIMHEGYLFRGVVQPRRKRATYCEQILYAPQYGQKTIPLSPVCT